jgi:hypothetical protein
MTPQKYELIPDHFTRSYDLAPTVDSTISNRAQPGEPGAHWVARGLMVETCAQMLGRPVRLDYREREHVTYATAYVSVASSIVTSDPLGAVIAVDLLISRSSGRWTLIVQDRVVGTGPYMLSPSHLAGLVLADHHQRRSPSTATCRGPVERPKHLW